MASTAKATHAEAAVMVKECRAHIVEVGWAKGSYKNAAGAVCLLQGLRDVDGVKHGKVVEAEVYRIVGLHTLGYGFGPGSTNVVTWNDLSTTTRQDVLDLLAACEAMERELAE